ncbi:MAG: DsbC family protein [Burkholderiales bacterium]|nr:DsbC family protein [Burkholderiales bacterium]
MKSIKFAAIALLSLVCVSSYGQNTEESAIKKLLETQLAGKAKVMSVTKTPYSGLFEVRTDTNEILYTDKKAQYLFVGRVINATTMEDYTKARVDEITKVKFSDLPLDSAIKMVKGDGKRVMAVFEDPHCGYCKRFRHTLQELDNVTVYTFMYNILSEDSAVKAKNIWCSPDRLKAWDDWMMSNKDPAPAPVTCLTNPNEKIFELGRKLKVTGTPTVIFADGSRVPGAVDIKTLENKLNSIK